MRSHRFFPSFLLTLMIFGLAMETSAIAQAPAGRAARRRRVVVQSPQVGADRRVTFQLRAKAGGTYESTVTDVSMSGWEYTAGANVEDWAEVEVPAEE